MNKINVTKRFDPVEHFMERIDPNTGELKPMIYKLLDPKHPLVQSELPEFVDSDQTDRKELLDNMIETMKHYGGIGLSANQVGLPYRMFVFGDNDNYVPCFNPKIISESEIQIPIEEGCLSFPGLFIKIYRPDTCYVQFEDENKSIHNDNFTGLVCRIFQHEMDHMNGIDFRTRATRMNFNKANRKRKRGLLKLKRSHGKDILKAVI